MKRKSTKTYQMTARYAGRCHGCGAQVSAGDTILYRGGAVVAASSEVRSELENSDDPPPDSRFC